MLCTGMYNTGTTYGYVELPDHVADEHEHEHEPAITDSRYEKDRLCAVPIRPIDFLLNPELENERWRFR